MSYNNNNMVLPLTDSSDESSIDNNNSPATTVVATSSVVESTSIMNTTKKNILNKKNTSMIHNDTTMSLEDDGSVVVVVDLTANDERNGRNTTATTTRSIYNENDMIPPPPNTTTTTTITNSKSFTYPPKRTRNHRWLTVVLGMIILLCFVSGIYFFLRSKRNTNTKSESKNMTPITIEELSLHDDTINDCWILIDTIIYDVTQYAPTHPGGSEYVTDFCGTNATKDYYINHPIEYLSIYLPSNTRVGVFSSTDQIKNTPTPIDTTTTTDDDDDDDDEKDEKDEKDDSKNERDDDDMDEDRVPTTTPKTPVSTGGVTTNAPTVPSAVSSCISLDEVMLHGSITDCYYILYGYVYDFTNYIDIHPGGARNVFQECGTDATTVYVAEKKHDEDLLIKINAMELYGVGVAC